MDSKKISLAELFALPSAETKSDSIDQEIIEEYQKQIEIELKDYVHNPRKYENLGYYSDED